MRRRRNSTNLLKGGDAYDHTTDSTAGNLYTDAANCKRHQGSAGKKHHYCQGSIRFRNHLEAGHVAKFARLQCNRRDVGESSRKGG